MYEEEYESYLMLCSAQANSLLCIIKSNDFCSSKYPFKTKPQSAAESLCLCGDSCSNHVVYEQSETRTQRQTETREVRVIDNG